MTRTNFVSKVSKHSKHSKPSKQKTKRRISRHKIFKVQGKKSSPKWRKHNVRKKDFMNIIKYKSKRKIMNKTSKLLLKSVRVIVQKTSRKIAKLTVNTFEQLNDRKCDLLVGMVPRLIVDTWILGTVNFLDSSNWPFYAIGWYLFVQPGSGIVVSKLMREAAKQIIKVFSVIPEFKKPLRDYKRSIIQAIVMFASLLTRKNDDLASKLSPGAKMMNSLGKKLQNAGGAVILGNPLGLTVMVKCIFAECCISILTTYVCRGPEAILQMFGQGNGDAQTVSN